MCRAGIYWSSLHTSYVSVYVCMYVCIYVERLDTNGSNRTIARSNVLYGELFDFFNTNTKVKNCKLRAKKYRNAE